MTPSETADKCLDCGADPASGEQHGDDCRTGMIAALAAKDGEIERLREVVRAWLEAPFFADRNDWEEWSSRLGVRARRALEGGEK